MKIINLSYIDEDEDEVDIDSNKNLSDAFHLYRNKRRNLLSEED